MIRNVNFSFYYILKQMQADKKFLIFNLFNYTKIDLFFFFANFNYYNLDFNILTQLTMLAVYT